MDFNCSRAVQMISDDGSFNLDNVDADLNLSSDNGLVGVVSIMGVQSSGKSTLMNKLFQTNFEELNVDDSEMSQTTRGIWMSKLARDDGGSQILLLDCEGSDGSERAGQGNETFERKVAFFALASSDVVIINMKCDNINLHSGSGMPLIRNVFQVMVRKFSVPRRITLLFVLRDKNKAPFEKLRNQLIRLLGKMWENMCNDLTAPYPALADYFKVEVKALSHYDHQSDAFNAEVVELREWIFERVNNGQNSNGTPSANFLNLAQKNWSDIQADKILNLVLNKNAANQVFFHTVMDDLSHKFSHDKSWIDMKRDVRIDVAEDFGDKVSTLIDTYLSKFDEETQSFNESSRRDSREKLTKRLLEVVEDTYLYFLRNKKAAALKKFEQDVKQKIEALDSNFDTEAYTKAIFDSLIEAKVRQAEDWNQSYDSYEEAKSQIDLYVEHARDLIKQRKEWEANRATQGNEARPTPRREFDLGAFANLLGNIAVAVANAFIPSAGDIISATRNLRGGQQNRSPRSFPSSSKNVLLMSNMAEFIGQIQSLGKMRG